MQTALDSFIDYKADTLMQCGNYSIDIPKLQEGEQWQFHWLPLSLLLIFAREFSDRFLFYFTVVPL
ncbi:hypothetical protein [Sulfurimonas sp.]|uniref:hypothetical protein n=1 Tax=Sulfurimonas sp. TaxID=2022749 RepID=UPI0035640CDE